jgi:hypothetical protein
MKTAVEWLEKEVNQYGILTKGLVLNLLSQAKEMDKQAHKETWDVAHQAGRFEGKGIAEENWQTFEEYWDETFKQQEQCRCGHPKVGGYSCQRTDCNQNL